MLLHLIQPTIYYLSYNKIKESAYETIQSHFSRSAVEEPSSPFPTTYFKLGHLYEINEDKLEIHRALLSIKKLLDPSYSLYDIKSPDFRCAAHAASGFVKRMEHPKQ